MFDPPAPPPSRARARIAPREGGGLSATITGRRGGSLCLPARLPRLGTVCRVLRFLRSRTLIKNPARALDVLAVLSVIMVVLVQLHLPLLFSSSMVTGGDTGSHFVLPAYLRTHDPFNLTPWYPGWYAGMPAYTYYFILPDIIAVFLSYVIPFAVAFKLATVLGSVALPVCAYAMGRLLRAPRPIPTALAMATLPFLFDASFTIDGGNLFSTMAGEYAFSLSLALALLTIGLFYRALAERRGYVVTALALSATLAAHVLPWFFALVGVAVLVVGRLLTPASRAYPRHRLLAVWIPFVIGLASFALSAWWLLPFGTTQNLTNSMGYVNNSVSWHPLLTTLGWYNSSGGAGGDRWVIVLGLLAAILAVVVRSRVGMLLAALMALSVGAYVADPQSVIWNERLIPFWFITIHLLAGWAVGYGLSRLPGRRAGAAAADAADQPSGSPTRLPSQGVVATVLAIVLGLASVVPGLIPASASTLGLAQGGNQVSYWAAWNYAGYQSMTGWPEFHSIITMLDSATAHHGCGRVMWEYNADQNRFGTPEALMTLPYWTHDCAQSMEGLLFESSATTPYHFLDQSELSQSPSDPQIGLPYAGLNVALGVQHLQMLGVRYFLAFSPAVVSAASADPALRLIATSPSWPAPGDTWRLYLVTNSQLVTGLSYYPTVVSASSRQAWLDANTKWWTNPKVFAQPLAASGPSSWPQSSGATPISRPVPHPAVVTNIHSSAQSLSFTVSHVGAPVLVKVSYYPRWRARGALGPYRVSPNLMVVVPTAHNVTLYYGTTPATLIGNVISIVAWLSLVPYAVFWVVRRRRRAKIRL